MRASRLVIVGAVLPLVLGGSLGSLTTDDGKGTWAYPMPATAFLVLSLGLAVSHLLVLLGYVEISRRSRGPTALLSLLGGIGSAALAGCEVWSGLMARTSLDAPVVTALDASFAVSSTVVVVGTLGAGLALRRSGSPLATPLLLNGLALLVATPVKLLASDGMGIAALTVWSLTYIWVGVRLESRESVSSPDAMNVSGHRLSTTEIGSALVVHPKVPED